MGSTATELPYWTAFSQMLSIGGSVSAITVASDDGSGNTVSAGTSDVLA